MGCGASVLSDEARELQGLSKVIDRELTREAKERNGVVKALLLGTGASGKSTICKQVGTGRLSPPPPLFCSPPPSLFSRVRCVSSF